MMSYAIMLAVIVAILAVVAIMGPFVVVNTIVRPILGLYLVVTVFVVETALVRVPPLPIGINVYPHDLVFVLLATCAVGRFLWQRDRYVILSAWMVLGVVWSALFVIGLVKFKTVAGVEFRPFFYFWAAVAYFASFTFTEAEEAKLWRALRFGVVALLLVACFRWVSDAIGLFGVNWGLLVGASAFRVLDSSHAHYLASMLAMLAVLHSNRTATRAEAYMAIFAALAVVILQHRTVWVLMFVAFVVLLVAEPDSRRRLALPALLLVSAGIIVGVFAIAFGSLDPVFAALQRSIDEALMGRGSTISWRVQSWQELLDIWANGGPIVNMFGYPFGNGWERYVADLKHSTNYSPHSFYVELLLRGGVVALVICIGVYFATGIGLRRSQLRARIFQPSALLAILAGQLVYAITYKPGYMQGVFLGVALSYLALAARAKRSKTELMRNPEITGWVQGSEP